MMAGHDTLESILVMEIGCFEILPQINHNRCGDDRIIGPIHPIVYFTTQKLSAC